MNPSEPELLIISGGSEVVGLALAEAANAAAIPYAVFSLVPRSVLRSAPGCVAFVDLSAVRMDWRRVRDTFLESLSVLSGRCDGRLAILPTEDGSLRLLNECRDDVLAFGEFSRARALRMGGVDKAEVVELIEREGMTTGFAPSMVLENADEGSIALARFGDDAIFKPALKPVDMDLSGMGGHGTKVITRRGHDENRQVVLARLREAWPISGRWIAQPRLRVGAGLERSVCAVRGSQIRACQVVERYKYPHMGGTAYWVSTDQRVDLVPPAARLLEALDVVGICELSFLPDNQGADQLIEFNPRPWLQVGLVERAGFPIVSETVSVLNGRAIGSDPPRVSACDWVQPERMLMALLAGHAKWSELARLTSAMFHRTTVIGGYGSTVPKAKRRLAARATRVLLRR